MFVDGDFVTPDYDGLGGGADEEGTGWDVDDDLELPPDLVSDPRGFHLDNNYMCNVVRWVVRW